MKILLSILYITFTVSLSYSQWLDAYIPDFKVNDDNLNSYQTNSQIGVDSTGNFVVVWDDVRINPGNPTPAQIYCQRYNKEGLPLGSNFRIGQDTAGNCRITVLKNGRFILTWQRFFEPLNKYEIYYQRYSSSGIALSAPLRVIDTNFSLSSQLLSGLNIASDSTGNFIICWSQKININANLKVYFQRFDSAGVKINGLDSVNEAVSNAEFPSIAMNRDGSFIIGWHDDRQQINTSKFDVYMQRYNSNGIKIGNNVKVNDDTAHLMFRGAPQVSTDGFGYSIIAWNDPRACGNGEIWYQLYDANGNTVGINRKANSSPCGAGTNSRVVSMRHDRYFYIGWSDWFYAGREQFYGRRFDNLGNPIGAAYMIPSASVSPQTQRSNSVYLLGDRVYSTWSNNTQVGSNIDIWCNVRGFQNPDTVIGIVNPSQIAKGYELYPAYPNPFNPSTNIKYSIAGSSHVKIAVYDISGKMISLLADKEHKAGMYEIQWNAVSAASGIYFVKLQSDKFSQTQKLILIK